MKIKGLALLLVLCLCVTCFAGCSKDDGSEALTATSGGVALGLGEVTAAPGESVSVPILVTENSQIAAVDLEVRFTSDDITYESFVAGEAFKGGFGDANSTETGMVKVCLATLNPPEEAGTIGILTFKVAEDAAAGKVPLTLTVPTCSDYDLNNIEVECVDGSITVQ